MKTQTGNIKIQAETKLVIEVGDNIKLTMNGNTGGVTLECSKLTMKTSGSTTIDATGSLKAKGTTVSLEASSMLKADSSGATMIGGSPIKIG